MNEKNEIYNLVVALKKGDKKAFKKIFNLFERRLYAFILTYTKDEFKAKDILQETFIKLWNKRDTLEPENSIKSYLFKTVYNTYIDGLRRMEAEQKMLNSWQYKRQMEMIDEDDEARKLRLKQVRQAVENLPKRCKEVFSLCKYEGFKYSEISEILGISEKTVQAQMVKAYRLIREELAALSK